MSRDDALRKLETLAEHFADAAVNAESELATTADLFKKIVARDALRDALRAALAAPPQQADATAQAVPGRYKNTVPNAVIDALNAAHGSNEWQGDATVLELAEPAAVAIRALVAAPMAVQPVAGEAELPDAIRVPLHSLWADAEYLIGRARAEPGSDLFVCTIKNRCREIEAGVRATFTTPPTQPPEQARDGERYRALCEDLRSGSTRDRQRELLRRMPGLGKGAIDAEADLLIAAISQDTEAGSANHN